MKTLKETIGSFGVGQQTSCECAFNIRMEEFQGVIFVDVDNLLVLSSDETAGKRVRDKMRSLFESADLGETSPYLGVSLEQKGKKMRLF